MTTANSFNGARTVGTILTARLTWNYAFDNPIIGIQRICGGSAVQHIERLEELGDHPARWSVTSVVATLGILYYRRGYRVPEDKYDLNPCLPIVCYFVAT